jgi:hypothetical protein
MEGPLFHWQISNSILHRRYLYHIAEILAVISNSEFDMFYCIYITVSIYGSFNDTVVSKSSGTLGRINWKIITHVLEEDNLQGQAVKVELFALLDVDK